MKKIIFLMVLAFSVMSLNASNSGEKSATATTTTWKNVFIELQTQTSWNIGSTVTYNNGYGYVTENLRVITNYLQVKQGTVLTIDLLVSGGGVMEVTATDYAPFQEADPVTRSLTYYISDDKNITVRIE